MTVKEKSPNFYYYKLLLYKRQYPELIYNNKGYDYLSKEVIERNKEGIEKISEVLRKTVEGFVKFNNFKKRENGTYTVRCQYKWNENFTGVGYFDLKLFKNTYKKEE